MAAVGTGTQLPLDSHEMQRVRAGVKEALPSLTDSFRVTSWPTEDYNCIGWAAEDQTNWWWPDPDGEYFWPKKVPREETVGAFVDAFRVVGYEPCDSPNLEKGWEKVAIYAIGDRVKHMARQLVPSGEWTSKLGEWWDISHSSPDEVEINIYGKSVQILKRRESIPTIPTHT
jgi:hypothetical protein